MGERLFEEPELAQLYQRYRISYEGSGIEEHLLNSLSSQIQQATQSCAVDIGCGTGFFTRLLSPHFTKVIGVDCSVAQLDVAKRATPQKNVEYISGTAEELHFISSNSVQLITVATALHYFDADKFFLEADRILVPSGCLFVVNTVGTSGLMVKILPHTTNTKVIKGVEDLMSEIGNFFSKHFEESTRQALLDTTPKPPSKFLNEKEFEVTTSREGNIDDVIGRFKASGVIQKYCRMNPEGSNILDVYKRRFLELLGEVSTTPEEVKITLSTPLRCWLFRKPKHQPTDVVPQNRS